MFFIISGTTQLSVMGESNWATALPDAPSFSLSPGFYPAGEILQITHSDPRANIYFTTDGSAPSAGSQLYSGPISLYTPPVSDSDFSNIRTNPVETDDKGFGWKTPQNYNKALVINAVACINGSDCSPAAGTTFFVDLPIPSVPVISIIMDPHYLFDHHDGIYIPGIVYAQNGYGDGHYGQPNANYFRDGDEWEFPAWFEYYDQGNAAITQTVGVRIHGGGTRALPMKSLRIYARSQYGESTLDFPFFPNQHHDEYKRLILRNSGQDFSASAALMRDGMLHKLAEPLNMAVQDYRPALLYLNGEFWGIHNIRERLDKHYFQRKYHIPEEQLDYLESNQVVNEGSADHYQAMIHYISQNNMADPQVYARVQTMMDTGNYIDYYIHNIYSNNIDWPGHNLKFWRRATDYQPHAAWGNDGRWRWALNDLDFAFGRAGGSSAYKDNTLAYATDPEGGSWPPNPPWSTFLIRKLLENQSFCNDFINRFAGLLNTAYSTAHVVALINQVSQILAPEMQQQIDRWGYPAENTNQWTTAVNRLKAYAAHRPEFQTQHILDYFDLSGTYLLTVDVSNQQAGIVRVNKTDISPDNPLLAHSGSDFPWQGNYFRDVTLPLKAIPSGGYAFEKWISSQGEEYFENPLFISPSDDIEFTAVFSPGNALLTMLHFWHFNDLPAETIDQLEADFSFTGNGLITYPGSGSGYMDMVVDGTALNAPDDAAPGNALRVRNPSDTRHLELQLPTQGYENITLSYALKRTANGARQQVIYYRTDMAGQWIQFGDYIIVNEDYELVTIDFSAIERSANNPGFAVRIGFAGPYASGSSGNNRFDNIRLEGTLIENANTPPYVTEEISLQKLIENGEAAVLDLSGLFTDDDGDPVTLEAHSSRPGEVSVSMSANILTVIAQQRGDAIITITASDGHNPPVSTQFRALVYPRARDLSQGIFEFAYWDPDTPERTYPENMLFVQSDTDDPGIDYPLLFPYHIPHDDYNQDDYPTIGFPYNNTRRTRINGLGEEGIAFINTGRGRDLGGALLAVNMTSSGPATISFKATTLLANSRIYNLRVQYRHSIEDEFTDLTDASGNLVEYQRSIQQGHSHLFENIPLPSHLQGNPYVQLLWKYYFTGEQADPDSGQRTQIALDNIRIEAANISEDNPLVLYPVPASNRITGKIAALTQGAVTWQITGIKGNVLFENTTPDHSGQWQQTIDVSSLAAGIYFFRVITREKVFGQKFIKYNP